MVQIDNTSKNTTRKLRRILPRSSSRSSSIKSNSISHDQMLRNGNRVIAALGDQGHLEHAEIVLELLVSHGIKPSIISYSTLISRAATWRNIQLAFKYFKEVYIYIYIYIYYTGYIFDLSFFVSTSLIFIFVFYLLFLPRWNE